MSASDEGAEPGNLLRPAAAVALGATLFLLPFERHTGAVEVGPLTITGLEIAWLAALVAWLILLAAERRPPALPRPVVAALGVLLVASLGSALLAGPQTPDALKFVARSGLGWLLFAAAADLVRTEPHADRAAHRLLACILGGAAVAALVGLVGPLFGQGDQLGTIGREYLVGGVRRLQGPFDYPNTAAMAWEVSGLCGLGLLWVATGRWQKLLIGSGLIVVTSAMLLTLSRGASLGALGGLGAMTLLAVVVRRWRPAAVSVGAAAFVAVGTIGVQLSGLPLDRLLGSEGDSGFYGATYDAPTVIRSAPGAQAEVSVSLTNTGSASWNSSSATDYRLAYRWLHPATGQLLADGEGRAGFDGPIAPGEAVTVAMTVAVPPRTGAHLLAWDLVHENTTWFSEKGVPVATSQVVIGGGAPASPTTIAPGALVELFPGLRPVPDRGQLWQAAAAMIGERPLLGGGPGTFRLRYGSYLGWDRWDERVHANNVYLELGATTGLVGLAAFVALVGYVLSRQLRQILSWPASTARAPSDAGWMLGAALVGAVVASLVHGLVDYFLGFNPTAGLFWAVLGVAMAIALGRPDRRVSSCA